MDSNIINSLGVEIYKNFIEFATLGANLGTE